MADMNILLNNKKKDEIYKSIEFIEELIWLIDSKKISKLKDTPQLMRDLLKNSQGLKVAEEFKSPNPNIHFLIGVLPRLFKDEVLFSTNLSIIEFAEDVLGIKMPRQGKRSRYELIGLIVCETDTLSDSELENLVNVLTKVTSNEEQLRKIKEDRTNNNFSWNETIQKLTERKNE
ncbi:MULTISPECIES: hypothetical protein [unclassified Paenibacillus]|uniref:hypothetical protein n=1 Tax=unclassified Paenibacillus TaxID=185978 RepID=UPI00363D0F1A